MGEGGVLGAILRGAGKLGSRTLKDAEEVGAGTLKMGMDAGEKIIDSATHEDGVINKIAKKYMEKIPEKERETAFENILPYRMKKYETKLNKSERGRVIANGQELDAVPSAMYKGGTWLKDSLIKSPGGRLALGVTGAGFVIGASEGGAVNKLGPIEGEKLANMVSDETSPLMNDEHAVNNVELHGINTYGADGNIVFALHNMR